MTSKEELQKHIQLLNEIKYRYPILNDTIKYLEQYQQSNSTLLECIKEWNEKGFEVDVYALEIVISGSTIELAIDLEDKTLLIEGSPFPFDLVPLIYRTIKSIEVENDKN